MNRESTSLTTRATCAYSECSNGRHNGQHLYTFPKDISRQKEWISKTGNTSLHKYAHTSLRQMGICAKHFSPEMFKPASMFSVRRVLKPNAVPNSAEQQECQEKQQQRQEVVEAEIETEEEKLHVKRPKVQYTRVPITFNSIDNTMEWMSIEPQPSYPVEIENLTNINCRELRLEKANIQLRKEVKTLKMKLHLLNIKFKRLKASRNHFYRKSKKKETIDEILDKHGCYNSIARTMVKLQLKRENVTYTTEEQDLAKMLFYSSASAYNNLRRSGCHLPCERTVQYWIAENNFDTGLSSNGMKEIGEVQ